MNRRKLFRERLRRFKRRRVVTFVSAAVLLFLIVISFQHERHLLDGHHAASALEQSRQQVSLLQHAFRDNPGVPEPLLSRNVDSIALDDIEIEPGSPARELRVAIVTLQENARECTARHERCSRFLSRAGFPLRALRRSCAFICDSVPPPPDSIDGEAG